MTKKAVLMTWILILCVGVAGCGGTTSEIDLEGTHWVLVEMNGEPPIEGRSITLGFNDGEVYGNLGCNSFSGDYSIRGEKLEFGMLMSTLMACVEAELMQQESRLFELLGQVEQVQILEGRLNLLLSDGGRLIFVPME